MSSSTMRKLCPSAASAREHDVRAHVGPGRVLHDRLSEVDLEARFALRGHGFENVNIGPFTIAGAANISIPPKARIAEHVVVAGVMYHSNAKKTGK